jgi:hypothetical protein
MPRRSLAPAGYISIKEAALRSGYTIPHLAVLARSGLLPACRVVRNWFIDERALGAFLSNRETRIKRGRPRKPRECS